MYKVNIIKNLCLLLFVISLSCKETKQFNPEQRLEARYQKLLNHPLDSSLIPRSANLNPEEVINVKSKDWTSGFYPGNLWLLYRLTNNESFKAKAAKWTALIEDQKDNDRTHDMGFKIYCSYGNAYKITKNADYKNIIIESAKTLATRYNENIGSIRSWDHNKDKWDFPVIIDNMMNLELLFEATKLSQDSLYHNIAVKHANTTLKNHFREDNSTYHVVSYDTISGAVKKKNTHQGFNHESSWARGQAWAVYGFTMSYRYTKDEKYLNQAVATANFFMNHKNLPQDGIPYWDFNDSSIPNAPRDVSGATIISSSLFELYSYTNDKKFLEFSNKIINSLKSKEYLLDSNIDAPFLLNHSTGNWPKNDEIDVPIVYADYYFLEALLRSKKFN